MLQSQAMATNTNELPLRPPDIVMRMNRLGAFHQTRLSFVRSLTRKMMREGWQIECTRFDLDVNGYGDVIFSVQTPGKSVGATEQYTIVFFTQYLDAERRSDRVIADAWDLAFALCEGHVDDAMLAELRANIPLQEAGRCRANVLVLSRANRSVRNFGYFVDTLASGKQPNPEPLTKVGYLYRTTAVYGNGKFGLADFEKLRHTSAFALPFSAQMFTVYMLRHFSIMQVNHLAASQNPQQAAKLSDEMGRYLGTGNATGLGMAPFLINHPQLIDQWISNRETAIARVLYTAPTTDAHVEHFQKLLRRARIHVNEIWTDDPGQAEKNCILYGELGNLDLWITDTATQVTAHQEALLTKLWPRVSKRAAEIYSLETQEMVNSILLELYPELVDELEATMGIEEQYDLIPQMSLKTLRELIESRYEWAISLDFSKPETQHFFWYRSAEKEEPRLGERAIEQGSQKEVKIDVARSVCYCYTDLVEYHSQQPTGRVIDFLLTFPHHRGTIRRIQAMGQAKYGDIQGNLLDMSCLPLNLLRCKLSFFGCSKFDPKSALWLRITLFQGAPLVHELSTTRLDDWFMPTMPPSKTS